MSGPGESRLKQTLKAVRALGEDDFDGWDIGADDYGSDPDYDFPQREQEDDECQ